MTQTDDSKVNLKQNYRSKEVTVFKKNENSFEEISYDGGILNNSDLLFTFLGNITVIYVFLLRASITILYFEK